MGSISIFHWLIVLIALAIYLIPTIRIFKRVGWSPWLVLVLLIPLAPVVMLWVFAFARWPAVDGPAPKPISPPAA